jgi:pimeloyl-ACP methyl ester carboxylesterase
MRKSRARESHPGRGVGLAAGLLTVAGAGAAVASEVRHRHALSGDPQWDLLRTPLAGDPLSVRSADGVQLHAEVFGPAEASTFVLIPGWTEELQIFDLLTRGLLGRGYRVVSYDLRGQGSSDSSRGLDQRIERYGEDLAAILQATCAGRDDVIVVGHSMGAMALVAWAAEADVRAHARAVALLNTGVSGLVDDLSLLPTSLPVGARRAILTPLLSGDQRMIAYSTPVSRAINRHVMFGPDATAAHVAFVEPMIGRMHGKLRAAAATTMRELDLTAALARVNVPALILVGDSDRLTLPVHARRMVAALPEAAGFVVLERTGHMTPLERPVEVADALERLARSVDLAPAISEGAGPGPTPDADEAHAG